MGGEKKIIAPFGKIALDLDGGVCSGSGDPAEAPTLRVLVVGEAPLGVMHRRGWGNRGRRHRATVSSCSALGRGVDGEGMVGPSGITEITRNMALALGAMKGGWSMGWAGGQSDRLSRSLAVRVHCSWKKRKKNIYIHT